VFSKLFCLFNIPEIEKLRNKTSQ